MESIANWEERNRESSWVPERKWRILLNGKREREREREK